MTTYQASDEIAVLANIDPDANTAATIVSPYASMEYFEQALLVVQAGDLGSSATLAVKLRQATSSTGAAVKDITSKAITTLTKSGTDGSNKQALVNLRATEMDFINGFTWVSISMTTAISTSDSGAVLLGFRPKHTPPSAHDSTTVTEIVA